MRTLLLIIVLVASVGVVEADESFSSQEEVGKWFTYYYLAPEPDRVSAAIRYMSRSGTLEKSSVLPGIFGFLSGIFASSPGEANRIISTLEDLPENQFSAVLLGLWYANIPTSQSLVYQYLDSNKIIDSQLSYLRTGKPMALIEIPLEQGPWVLDALWGQYFSTGKPEPVERISEALPWSEVKGDIGRLLIGGAAKWSLSSNAFQHERVKEILVSLSERKPKNQYLIEVLTQAAKYEAERANKQN